MQSGLDSIQSPRGGPRFSDLGALFEATPGLAGVRGANEAHFDALMREFRKFEGNLVPCIGAGMSAPMYPTWGEALNHMASLVPHLTDGGRTLIASKVSNGDYDDAAMELYERAGRVAFEDSLRETFHENHRDPALISKMPSSLLPEVFSSGVVLTLNFDTLLETSVFTGPNSFGDRIVRGPVHFTQDRQDMIRSAHRTLLKVHGCATRPREVVFTRQQYDQHYGTTNDSSNSDFLTLLFQSHPILFLGCSLLGDRMMELLESIARKDDLPQFALLPIPASDEQFAKAGQRLANAGIRPIWYPTGEHHFVGTVLHAMREDGPKIDFPNTMSTGVKPSASNPNEPTNSLCIGRDADVAEVTSRLVAPDGIHAVEVQGAPGVGKSTVCRTVLDGLRQQGWTTVEVSLSEVKDKQTATLAMWRAMRAHDSKTNSDGDGNEIEDLIVAAMSIQEKTVVYLDNMEDPQEDPEFVQWFIKAISAAKWRILYSTQTAIMNPRVFRYQLGPLDQTDGEALFRLRWAAELRVGDSQALTQLVSEAGCHPLSLILIAGQRDRWRTIPEVLQAWRQQAQEFEMRDAEPRHRSIVIAYNLARDRVVQHTGCLELLAALTTVTDHLPSNVMEVVLGTYPPLKTDDRDPLMVLLRHGLIESSVRHAGGVARTVYSVLNPLKRLVRDSVDDSTMRRAVERMSKVYETFLEEDRNSAASQQPGARGLADALAIQAATLLISSGDWDVSASSRLMHAMRDHIENLPTGLRLIMAQYNLGTATILGGSRLDGHLEVLSSARPVIPLLLAAAMRFGVSTIRNVRRNSDVEEVGRLLTAVGVTIQWSNDESEVRVDRPRELDDSMIGETEVVSNPWGGCLPLLFLDAPMCMRFPIQLHRSHDASLFPNLYKVLERVSGRSIKVDSAGVSLGDRCNNGAGLRRIVLTGTDPLLACLALIGSAASSTASVFVNVPTSLEVGELCAFLECSGMEVSGMFTSTLRIGRRFGTLEGDVVYGVAPDPLDAVCLIVAAAVTGSRVRVERVPIQYMDVELELLREFGVQLNGGAEYPAPNGLTRLIDLEVDVPRGGLHARNDKVHADPHGVSVESLPFVLLLSCHSMGRTLVEDWVHRNGWMDVSLVRLIFALVLLGARIEVLDSFRVLSAGSSEWGARRVSAPEEDGPAMCLIVACLGIDGEIEVNHLEDRWGTIRLLAERLNAIGADIRLA